jgi:ABC-type multidrug transport system fused ATPase/permease subunit
MPDRDKVRILGFYDHFKKVNQLLENPRKKSFRRILIAQSILSLLETFLVASLAFISIKTLNALLTVKIDNLSPVIIEINFIQSFRFQLRDTLLIIFILLLLLLLKDFLSLCILKRTIKSMSLSGLSLSNSISKRLLNSERDTNQSLNLQETSVQLTDGVFVGVVAFLAQIIVIAAEILLILTLTIFLVAYNLLLTFSLVLVLGFFAFWNLRFVQYRIHDLSYAVMQANNRSQQYIYDSYRLIDFLRPLGKVYFFHDKFMAERKKYSKLYGEIQFSQQSPKYFMDIYLIFFTIFVFTLGELQGGFINALESSLVFFLASSRLVPSILRVQTALSVLSRSQGMAVQLFNLIDNLPPKIDWNETPVENVSAKNGSFADEYFLSISNLTLSLGQKDAMLPTDLLNLQVRRGTLVGVTGKSGVGKSTFLNAIAGNRLPRGGSIQIEGLSPQDFSRLFPGKLVFLSQRSWIAHGNIAQNVSFEDVVPYDEKRIWEALEKVDLASVVKNFSAGIYHEVNPEFPSFSGGEQQRLAIARALYQNPEIILMDEPTTGLDIASEEAIVKALRQSKKTVLIVTHSSKILQLCDEIITLCRK